MENNIEKRAAAIEYRDVLVVDDVATRPVIFGYAAIYNTQSNIIRTSQGRPFVETILEGAFDNALAVSDVRGLINHNRDLVLARSTAGTLRLTTNNVGLYIEIDVPNTTVAADVYENIRLGNINQMSFGFIVDEDEWDFSNQIAVRTIKKFKVITDISVVTIPAYEDTCVDCRSLEEAEKKVMPIPEESVESNNGSTQILKLKLAQRVKEGI